MYQRLVEKFGRRLPEVQGPKTAGANDCREQVRI